MLEFHFESVDSTNEAAKRLLAEGAIRDFALVTAREQTAGKGTRGRAWASPRDAGLYMTVVHRDVETGFPTTGAYAWSAGIACVEVLAEAFGVKVGIKPINDLWVEDRKLGGILVETTVEQGKTQAIMTGIGINLRRAERQVSAGAAIPVCIEELSSIRRSTKSSEPRPPASCAENQGESRADSPERHGPEIGPPHPDEFGGLDLARRIAKNVNLWHQKIFKSLSAEVEYRWRQLVLPQFDSSRHAGGG